MTDHERRILEQTVRESPKGRPSFTMEVLVPPGVFSLAAYLAFVAAGIHEQAAVIFAAAVCAVALLWRLLVFDTNGRPVSYVEHTRYVDEPKKRLRPIVGSSDAQHLTVGRWRFKEAEWVRLGRVLATGKLTREPLRDLQRDDGEPMWPTLNERYPSIVEEFHRIGWVDRDNTVTNAARAWYEDHGLAFATPLPGDGR